MNFPPLDTVKLFLWLNLGNFCDVLFPESFDTSPLFACMHFLYRIFAKFYSNHQANVSFQLSTINPDKPFQEGSFLFFLNVQSVPENQFLLIFGFIIDLKSSKLILIYCTIQSPSLKIFFFNKKENRKAKKFTKCNILKNSKQKNETDDTKNVWIWKKYKSQTTVSILKRKKLQTKPFFYFFRNSHVSFIYELVNENCLHRCDTIIFREKCLKWQLLR